jgi:hypothetical protein
MQKKKKEEEEVEQQVVHRPVRFGLRLLEFAFFATLSA